MKFCTLPIRAQLVKFHPLTTREAARFSMVSETTVRRWVDSGMLKGRKIPPAGIRRVIEARDLLKFLERHNVPVAQELKRMCG